MSTTDLCKTPRARAVLDEAHIGDIRGALGTIRQRRHRTPPRLVGTPADAARHPRAGPHRHGRRQRCRRVRHLYPGRPELWHHACCGRCCCWSRCSTSTRRWCLRLGTVTGVGHARLILERFGRFWGAFSVIDLFLLNALTIVTEFIGISLALDYLGLPRELGRDRFGRDHHCRRRHRRFPPLRAVLAAFGLRQPAVDPGVHLGSSADRRDRAWSCRSATSRGWQAERSDPADHRDCRHHGRALAAFLPAELRHRQAHHAALHALRARRSVDRHRARDHRRGRDDGVHRRNLRGP